MNTTDTTNQSLIRLSEVLNELVSAKLGSIVWSKMISFCPLKLELVAFVESEIDAWIQSVIETSRNNVA